MNIRPLSKCLQEKAIIELNERPGVLQETLSLFKEWLSKKEHLKIRNDDQLLVNILRASKFRLPRAKNKIEAYYSFKTWSPEIARNLDTHLPAIQSFFKLGLCIPLPSPQEDPAGPRVVLVRCTGYDPDEITFVHLLKSAFMVFDILLNDDDNYVVSGASVIWDLKGVQLKTALQITPTLIKKTVFCFETAFPSRIKAIYVLNVPKFFEKILNIAKMLVSDKLAKRLHFYSTNNMELIYQNISKSILPTEYGGYGGTVDNLREKFQLVVNAHRERLLQEDSYYSDESKRLDTTGAVSDIFGMVGSFTKLQID